MRGPADVHRQVLAGRDEDVVVVVRVPVDAEPAGADPAGVVGIAVGVDLGAVVQPRVLGWHVDVVGRVDPRAAVVVRGAGLVVRRYHRHVDGVWAATHVVVHADEDGLAAVLVAYGAGQLALDAAGAVARGVRVDGGRLQVEYVQVEPVLRGERQVHLHGVALREVQLVVVVPVPAVVRPAGGGLVHRLYPDGVGPAREVAAVLSGSEVVRVRDVVGFYRLVIDREGDRVVQLPVHGSQVLLHLDDRVGLRTGVGVPEVGVVGRDGVRVAQGAGAPVDVRRIGVADVHVQVEPQVVVGRAAVGLAPFELRPDSVVGGYRQHEPVLVVVGRAYGAGEGDLLARYGE